jgi:hypothetical protein
VEGYGKLSQGAINEFEESVLLLEDRNVINQ